MENRSSRRRILQSGAAIALGSAILAGCDRGGGNGAPSAGSPTPTPTLTPTPTPTPTPASPAIGTQAERDLMNFALNILYLEAQFYSYAVTGQGLPAGALTGTGTAGAASGGRQNTFESSGIAERFREINYDTAGQVTLFRELLGNEAIAQPTIDLAVNAGPFGVIGRSISDSALDPYANDLSLLLAAFYLIEPSLTVLKRAAWQITTKQLADAVTAVVAAKAGHAGMIRLQLIKANFAILNHVQIAHCVMRMSDLRERLGETVDVDESLSKSGVGTVFSPASDAGYFPERTPAQARPIYLLAAPTIDRGGFFPNGMNGNLAR